MVVGATPTKGRANFFSHQVLSIFPTTLENSLFTDTKLRKIPPPQLCSDAMRPNRGISEHVLQFFFGRLPKPVSPHPEFKLTRRYDPILYSCPV